MMALSVSWLSRLVREPDDLGIFGRSHDLARFPQLLLDLAQPRLGAAGDGDLPGADDLVDAEGAEQLDDGLDLRLLPGGLQRVGAGRDVHDLGPEDVADAEDLRPVRRLGVHL